VKDFSATVGLSFGLAVSRADSTEALLLNKSNSKENPMTKIEKEILRMEENLTQTEMKLDVEALERIYADDIMVTAPIGVCVDKPAVMDEVRLAAAKAVIGKYDKGDLKVRAFGDTAVSSYRMTAEATFEGVEIKQRFCITNVWMKRGDSWQIVARHTASLAGDPTPVPGCEQTS
jgi:ketosteroid isomerase-like protein